MIYHFCTKKAATNEAIEAPTAIFLSALPYMQAPTQTTAAILDMANFLMALTDYAYLFNFY